MSEDEEIVGFHVPGKPQPESRFFTPTVRCPHPERWTATDGDSTEREVAALIGALVVAVQPDVVVETGTAFGETTRRITAALMKNGRGHLYSLETDPKRIDYVKRHSPPEHASFWTLVEESSLEWMVPPGPNIDLLFSDTARDIRIEEVLRFLPRMHAGSLAVVHDSSWDAGPLRGWIENSLVTPGLVRAIDLPTPRGLTICEVLSSSTS